MSGSTRTFIDLKIQIRSVMVFGKSNDPDSQQVKQILEEYFLPKDVYEWIDIEKRQDCKQIENYFRILCLTDRRQTPYIFIDQLYFGSLFELNICHKNGSLKQILKELNHAHIQGTLNEILISITRPLPTSSTKKSN